jgi:hypothetical protein
MATLRHAHSSSLYSESPTSLAAQVDRGVSAEDPSANLMSYTEVGSDKRAQVLKDADPAHWAAWVPGQSDVGLMWLKATWSPVWKEPHKLTDKVWTDGKGRKHETWCATALLEHDGGGTLFYSVAHLPSHVQNGQHFYDNAQAKAWKSACSGWSDYWNNKRKKHNPRAALIVADWNVDFHSDTWRDRVKGYFPSMHLTWQDGTFPAKGKGTHGSRLIDGTMATVKPNDCWLLKDDSSSDHRPYGEVLPWP